MSIYDWIRNLFISRRNKKWEVKSKTTEHNTIGTYEVSDDEMDDEDKKDLE